MLENILQLTAVVVVFILVLAGTYYVTKWIAKSGMIQSQSRNIKVDRKSTRLNSSHNNQSRMPSSA